MRWFDRIPACLIVAAVLSAGGAVALVAPLVAQVPYAGQANGNRWSDTSHDVHSFDKPYTFATLSAVAATEAYKAGAHVHGVYVVVTGSPAACTGRLQGSGDGVNYFDLDAADETCTSNVATFLVDKPALWVRWNLKTLSGGTSPTVSVSYVGF